MEDHDNNISDLYRQSSQETPAAHVDRAVMDRARKSVRRRVFAPFGDNWVAHGAMVGVIILGVLLLLDVPQQTDTYLPSRDAVAPSKEKREVLEEREQSGEVLLDDSIGVEQGVEKKRAAPVTPKARFDAYEKLQDSEVNVPEAATRSRMLQVPAPAAEEPASLTSKTMKGPWYLQAGSFRDKERADELKLKLTELGFRCEIEAITTNNTDINYRVRVGPFTDLEVLEQSRQKLGELGIETRTVTNRE